LEAFLFMAPSFYDTFFMTPSKSGQVGSQNALSASRSSF
jgi:hypothetical protein